MVYLFWVGWVLWHINPSGLFNDKYKYAEMQVAYSTDPANCATYFWTATYSYFYSQIFNAIEFENKEYLIISVLIVLFQ